MDGLGDDVSSENGPLIRGHNQIIFGAVSFFVLVLLMAKLGRNWRNLYLKLSTLTSNH